MSTRKAANRNPQIQDMRTYTAISSLLRAASRKAVPYPKKTLIKIHDISLRLNSSRASRVKVVKKPDSGVSDQAVSGFAGISQILTSIENNNDA
jgi:hypothetical protein